MDKFENVLIDGRIVDLNNSSIEELNELLKEIKQKKEKSKIELNEFLNYNLN